MLHNVIYFDFVLLSTLVPFKMFLWAIFLKQLFLFKQMQLNLLLEKLRSTVSNIM